MDRQVVGEAVRRVLASLSKSPPSEMHDGSTLQQLGMDSASVLVLRETLERRFDITIDDSEVGAMLDVGSIVRTVVDKAGGASLPEPSVVESTSNKRIFGGSWLDEGGQLWTDVEIGMPLTGANNLSEGALLREVGHLRWQHMTALTGVCSRDIVDEFGERLYPTFFYAEVAFPRGRPMGTFRENDAFVVASTLRSYGRAILDGEHYLMPRNGPTASGTVPKAPQFALQQGIPYVRLSNSFVQKWQGTEWLKRSRPVSPGFDRVPEVVEVPDSYDTLMRIKRGEGRLIDPSPIAVPLSPEPMTVSYEIVPERDLNGAGLIYFANYPVFLDIAERAVLKALAEPKLSDDILVRRTLVHRKSVYLGNASAEDVLDISLRMWVDNPFLVDRAAGDRAPVRILIEYRMNRRSDGRLMMISTASKVLLGLAVADTPLGDWLRRTLLATEGA